MEIGTREPITQSIINMIIETVGLGAIILDLHKTDYSRGSMQTSATSKCFWLTDGRRVDISMVHGGGFVCSITKEPDENIPEPLQEEGK